MLLKESACLIPFVPTAADTVTERRANAELEKARTAVTNVAQNPMIEKMAPVSLAHAQEMLARADAAHKAGKDDLEVEDYAYIARRQAWMAEARARIAAGEKGITFGGEHSQVTTSCRG